jgi:ABC-type dipeptide/oligopeptide/nickel transport system permease component
MALAVLGILLSLLFAVAALRYLAIRPPDQTDRIGARIFFIVIGLPVLFVGVDLISQNTDALMHVFGY